MKLKQKVCIPFIFLGPNLYFLGSGRTGIKLSGSGVSIQGIGGIRSWGACECLGTGDSSGTGDGSGGKGVKILGSELWAGGDTFLNLELVTISIGSILTLQLSWKSSRSVQKFKKKRKTYLWPLRQDHCIHHRNPLCDLDWFRPAESKSHSQMLSTSYSP